MARRVRLTPQQQYRQGDLLFTGRSNIPVGATRSSDGLIQRNESSGNAHDLVDGVVYERGGNTYLKTGTAARVVHEEHRPLELPVGFYLVIRQREYWGEEEWDDVND